MPDIVCLGFDFGFKRIGVAVGQTLTCTASPLTTLHANSGVPDWNEVKKIIDKWRPDKLIVGLPTSIDESELYTTEAARNFADQLRSQFSLPVHLVDERLTTKEAREKLFRQGGYRRIQKSQIDAVAASIILEQWLQFPNEDL